MPFLFREYDEYDPLNSARGIIIGLIFSIPCDIMAVCAIVGLWRRYYYGVC